MTDLNGENADRETSQARLACLVASSDDAIIAKTPDGVIVEWNEAAEKLYGYSAGEIIGRNVATIVPPDLQSELADLLGRVRQGHGIKSFETLHVRKDGSTVPVALTMSPIVNHSGETIGISTIARDITDKRKFENDLKSAYETENRHNALLKSIDRAAATISETLAASPSPDLNMILHTIVVQAQALTGAELAALGIGKDPEKPFDPWVFSGISPDAVKAIGRFPRPIGLLGAVIRKNGTLRIGTPLEHPEALGRLPSAHPPIRSFLGVPIRFHEKNMGTLYLANKREKGEFTAEDQMTVEILATRAGVALETAQLYQEEASKRAWLRGVIDQAPQGIVIFDKKGNVVIQNRAALALCAENKPNANVFDYPICRGVEKSSRRSFSPDEVPFVRTWRTRQTVIGAESFVKTQNGRFVPVEISASPILGPRNEVTGIVGVIHNIARTKELERLKEEWTSIVVHDLRQPVSVIAMAAHLLKDDPKSRSEDESETIEIIIANASKLNHMIQDLLDASKIETHRLDIHPTKTDLTPLLEKIVSSLKKTAPGRDVRVAVPRQPCFISIDTMRLEQIVGNLFSNAVKYSFKSTPIEIRLECRHSDFRISVSNFGKGIAKKRIPHLFQRFYRAPETSKIATGTGLGLYICKELVEAHGGRIWAQSHPRGKTTFTFSLPRYEATDHDARAG